MSERKFEPMTKAEVIAAQREWARCVTEQDVDRLLELYDFGTPDEPLLFKPTLADVIRLDRAGARLQGHGALHLRRRRRQRHARRLHLRLPQAERARAHLVAPLLTDVAARGRVVSVISSPVSVESLRWPPVAVP